MAMSSTTSLSLNPPSGDPTQHPQSQGLVKLKYSLLEYDPTRMPTIKTHFRLVAKTLLRLRFKAGIGLEAD